MCHHGGDSEHKRANVIDFSRISLRNKNFFLSLRFFLFLSLDEFASFLGVASNRWVITRNRRPLRQHLQLFRKLIRRKRMSGVHFPYNFIPLVAFIICVCVCVLGYLYWWWLLLFYFIFLKREREREKCGIFWLFWLLLRLNWPCFSSLLDWKSSVDEVTVYIRSWYGLRAVERPSKAVWLTLSKRIGFDRHFFHLPPLPLSLAPKPLWNRSETALKRRLGGKGGEGNHFQLWKLIHCCAIWKEGKKDGQIARNNRQGELLEEWRPIEFLPVFEIMAGEISNKHALQFLKNIKKMTVMIIRIPRPHVEHKGGREGRKEGRGGLVNCTGIALKSTSSPRFVRVIAR